RPPRARAAVALPAVSPSSPAVRRRHRGCGAVPPTARAGSPAGSDARPGSSGGEASLTGVNLAAATPARARGAVAIGALAVGAAAVGGFAVGRLSIGRLAIGKATIGKLAVKRLEIEELEIGRLTVREGPGSDAK